MLPVSVRFFLGLLAQPKALTAGTRRVRIESSADPVVQVFSLQDASIGVGDIDLVVLEREQQGVRTENRSRQHASLGHELSPVTRSRSAPAHKPDGWDETPNMPLMDLLELADSHQVSLATGVSPRCPTGCERIVFEPYQSDQIPSQRGV